jgi:hypothetical protein
MTDKFFRFVCLICAFGLLAGVAFAIPVYAAEPPEPAPNPSLDVIGAFTKEQDTKSEIVAIPDQKKKLIMFLMGVPLLVFILVTAALGIAMGVYGKPVYVPHMIFAGLSVTLAIAHAVVGIVWFFPF